MHNLSLLIYNSRFILIFSNWITLHTYLHPKKTLNNLKIFIQAYKGIPESPKQKREGGDFQPEEGAGGLQGTVETEGNKKRSDSGSPTDTDKAAGKGKHRTETRGGEVAEREL